MIEEQLHPAVTRILAGSDGGELLSTLASQLSGADLTALLLEVMKQRAEDLAPSDVLAQYSRDRFVQPAIIDARRILELELLTLTAVHPTFTPITPSPVAPLGTHSVIAGVHQNRVVTTIRGTEVAADPTNSLALEAALHRKALLSADRRSSAMVRLACVNRVLRAQTFEGPRSFAHFSLLGLVTAGRDTGDRHFEAYALREHLQALIDISLLIGFPAVTICLTDFSGQCQQVVDELMTSLTADLVTVVDAPERIAGRGYYDNVCFKLVVSFDDEDVEVGDGGLVNWTQSLLGNRKERLMTSGLSLERLALFNPRPI
jgi:hypothetical protein